MGQTYANKLEASYSGDIDKNAPWIMVMYIDLQHSHNHYNAHNKNSNKDGREGGSMEVELKTMISLTKMIISFLSRKQFNQN